MPQRQIKTSKISGGAEYAKVADRMLEFRKDWPRSKSMVASKEHKNQEGVTIEVEFFCWLWKDKAQFDKLVESGVTDMEVLKSTADANATATATTEALKAAKAREKHQSVATGRALAYLGYTASGEIASFEEMELYEEEKQRKNAAYIENTISALENAKTLDELKELWLEVNLKANPEILATKDKRKAELESKPVPKKLPKEPKVEVIKEKTEPEAKEETDEKA